MRWFWYPHCKIAGCDAKTPAYWRLSLWSYRCGSSRIKRLQIDTQVLCAVLELQDVTFQSIGVSSGIAWSCYTQDAAFLRMERHTHLISHSANKLRSSCSASQSDWSSICLYTMRSSAKSLVFDAILSGRSFMKRRKSRGPRTDPCSKGRSEKLGDNSPGHNAVLSWTQQRHWQISNHQGHFLSVKTY